MKGVGGGEDGGVGGEGILNKRVNNIITNTRGTSAVGCEVWASL